MNKYLNHALFYLLPAAFVAGAHFFYYSDRTDAPGPDDSRIRYLAVPSDRKHDLAALDEIYVEGDISKDSLKAFRETIDRHNLKHAKVIFNSEGGNLEDAIELGYLIRDLGFSTDVGEYTGTWDDSYTAACFSACTAAFIGGKFRYFHPESQFGVHRYKTTGTPYTYGTEEAEADAQQFSGYILDYITGMGIDPQFYEITVAQDHEDIEYLGNEELIKLKVVNNGAQDPVWEMGMDASGGVLNGRQERPGQDGTVSLRCADGLRVEFTDKRRQHDAAKPGKLRFRLLADGREMDVTPQIGPASTAEAKAPLKAVFRPTDEQLLAMLGSDTIGLAYRGTDAMESTYRIGIDKDRGRISDFIRFCRG
jgi:hypothetical protein